MTQPPTVPGQQPGQYWPPQTQPSAYGPPPGYAPAGPPVKPPNPKLVFWTSAPGIISMLAIMGVGVLVLLGISNKLSGPASDNFAVDITSCSATTGSLSTAKVGLTIKNTGETVRSATVKVEYRDGSGNRLDTDTVYARNIQPGDTARVDESTILDGEASGSIRCVITGVS